jgi:hypothetical protein
VVKYGADRYGLLGTDLLEYPHHAPISNRLRENEARSKSRIRIACMVTPNPFRKKSLVFWFSRAMMNKKYNSSINNGVNGKRKKSFLTPPPRVKGGGRDEKTAVRYYSHSYETRANSRTWVWH